jgi:hypothetical protein
MKTKIKLLSTGNHANPEMVPFSQLQEGDWFVSSSNTLSIGVIVDGKPFYPSWNGGYYRSSRGAATYSSTVRRIRNLVLQEKCRG